MLMTRPTQDSRLPSQETLLRDYTQRLGRHRQGRRAVHIHLSRLRPYNRRDHHLRIAANTFESLVTIYEGQIFPLANADIVFVCKGASVADLDAAIVKVRYLFSEDPVTQDDRTGQPDRFCTWYDLATDYDAFLATAESLYAEHEKRRTAPAAPVAPAGPPRKSLDPAELGKIVASLARADLSNVMRRQPVCALLPGQPPQIVFHELYVSIAGLQQVIAPGIDLASNRWLFQYLTETLDKRMLALVSKGLEASLSSRFSLNLNVATLLSPEFLAFDASLKAAARGTLVVELQAVDIFADMNAYIFARDFLRERGYRLCLDGLSHLSIGLVDRAKLALDLVKIVWSSDMLDDPSGQRHDELKRVVATIGESRVILTRCDSAEAVQRGESFGICMFQGRHLDALVEKSKKILQ
jgi:EAL domain-containing protein (putative c-di-GMP-specific phosphodiesterase class I)